MARRERIADVKDDIIRYVRSGVSHEDAAAMAGINESTLYMWKAKGREAKSGIYHDFYEQVRHAEIEAKIRKVNVVERAAANDPKLALEILARKYPKEWGRKDRMELGGEGGGPIPIQVVSPNDLNL